MAVSCGGINEKLPVTCACVAKNALLYHGTAQREVFRKRPARTCGVIVLQKPPDPIIVSIRGVNALQYRPIPVQQALHGHRRDETQIEVGVVSICVADNASFML